MNLRFTLQLEPGQCWLPLHDLQSINAHAEKKEFELRRTGDSAEIQDTQKSGKGQWRSPHNEEAQVYDHDL